MSKISEVRIEAYLDDCIPWAKLLCTVFDDVTESGVGALRIPLILNEALMKIENLTTLQQLTWSEWN